MLFEYPTEIEWVIITNGLGDVVDVHIGFDQKIFCLRHSCIQKVFIRRYSELLCEQVGEIGNADVEHFRICG